MSPKQISEYYSRQEIQQAILSASRNREVAGIFRNGGFTKRPNALLYPKDITTMAGRGILEFHGSIEHWSNPMAIIDSNQQELRTGWDIVLDLDCKKVEHGKIAARVFANSLERHDVKNYSIKFTGGTGFHIAVPWKSIPKQIDYKPSVKQFPGVPRTIVLYLKEFARSKLSKRLLNYASPEKLAKEVDKPIGKILTEEGLDPFQVVDVDSVLVSPRHLFRLPYSINSKTFFVSLPLKAERIEEFELEKSRPDNIKKTLGFLERGEENEAELLVSEALDWSRENLEEKRLTRPRLEITDKIPKGMFPPCIKNISKGLVDGKRRSVFVLISFLRTLKWTWSEIEHFLMEWNRKNKPPLKENYIRSQLKFLRNKNKQVPPPNCTKETYYVGFGVCKPDPLCGGEKKTIKNPVMYPLKTPDFKSKIKKDEKPRKRKKRKEPAGYGYVT